MARRTAKPDPWEGCPWIAEALVEGDASRDAALVYARRFSAWILERFTVATSKNLDELMRRLEASETVAELLEFKLVHPEERTPAEAAEAVGVMLEGIVLAHAHHLRGNAPLGTDRFADVPTRDLRRAASHPETLTRRQRDTIAIELVVRGVNVMRRKRSPRRTWSPVHLLADAVDRTFSSASARRRDSIIVALAREVLGVETTAGKVHELRKRARSTFSKTGQFPTPRI